MVKSKYYWSLWLVLVLVIGVAAAAHAHRVNIFAWVEGDNIYTESKFSGGKPVHNGQVRVFGPDGAQLLEGTTDDQGLFHFPIPQRSDLTVEVAAGSGHANTWRITADELGGTNGRPTGERQTEKDTAQPSSPAARSVSADLTTEQLEQVIGRVVDQKIAPINRRLAELQTQGPSMRDIIGGIGYIIGLVGVGTYVSYRRRGKQKQQS
jgi:nickel transport protein